MCSGCWKWADSLTGLKKARRYCTCTSHSFSPPTAARHLEASTSMHTSWVGSTLQISSNFLTSESSRFVKQRAARAVRAPLPVLRRQVDPMARREGAARNARTLSDTRTPRKKPLGATSEKLWRHLATSLEQFVMWFVFRCCPHPSTHLSWCLVMSCDVSYSTASFEYSGATPRFLRRSQMLWNCCRCFWRTGFAVRLLAIAAIAAIAAIG